MKLNASISACQIKLEKKNCLTSFVLTCAGLIAKVSEQDWEEFSY